MTTLQTIDVRDMQESDLVAYKALRNEMLSHYADAFTSDAASESQRTLDAYRRRLGEHSEDGTFTLVACSGAKLVGAVTIERDNRSQVRHVGHLTGMFVRTDAQRTGVGRALMEAVMSRCAADPELEQLTLSVSRHNKAAIALYGQFGFRRYGLHEGAVRVSGAYIDKELMSARLR